MAPPPEVHAYFLTWRTYGTWLPGDERGWVSQDRNGYGEPMHSPDYRLENAARGQMNHLPVELTSRQRSVIDEVLREACEFRGWTISALNVRTNHVHLVVGLDGEPQKATETLKARVTRVMRERDELGADARIWARGGSCRVLWNDAAVESAIDYVLNRQ